MPADTAALSPGAGWLHTLYYMRGFKITGHLVVMIMKMLFNDVLRFVVVFLIVSGGSGSQRRCAASAGVVAAAAKPGAAVAWPP